MQAKGAEAWAATNPAIDDCDTRRDSGPRRGTRTLPQERAVRAGALQNEERGMRRRAKGRQPRTSPGGGLGFLSDPTVGESDATARATATEVRPRRSQSPGLSFVR
jgi:hypothetical protein